MEAELLTEGGHVVRFLSKPKVALLRWRSTLEQRSEPPRIREKQKEENKQGWREVGEEGRAQIKGEGQPQSHHTASEDKELSGSGGVSPAGPNARPRMWGLFGQLGVTDPRCSECSVGSAVPAAQRGGCPKCVCVCGQGTTLPPRARDYRQHSWESQNASEGSRRIQQCNCLTLINRVYFTFF